MLMNNMLNIITLKSHHFHASEHIHTRCGLGTCPQADAEGDLPFRSNGMDYHGARRGKSTGPRLQGAFPINKSGDLQMKQLKQYLVIALKNDST